MLWFKRGIVGLGILVTVLFIAAWIFLTSGMFSETRIGLVQKLLVKELGRDIQITGDVRVSPGIDMRITAEGLSLPSASMPDTTLARVETLAFDLPVQSLWQGGISLSNIELDGLGLTLLADEAGSTSWAPPSDQQPKSSDAKTGESKQNTTLANLFTDRRLAVTHIDVLYQDARNGLDLNLQMAEIMLDRGNDKSPRSIQGSGTLNGEALTLTGALPRGEAFSVSLAFDQMTLTFDGKPATGGYESGFEVAMAANVAALGQLLDVAKLDRVLEGTGTIGAVLKSGDGVARIDDVNILVELDSGQSLEVTGHVGELGNPADVSLATRIRLFQEDAVPPPALFRRDLKLISVDMEIDSVPGQTAQRKMVIETNGFVLNTAGEGPAPIKVSGVSRTPEGKLRLGNVNLRIGQPDEPFVILNGIVADALSLQDISAEGILDISAGGLIAPELAGKANGLGRFTGEFHLNGNIEKLTLTDLNGRTTGTDLWDLNVSGNVANVLKFEDIDLDVAVNVPSGAELMTAMTLRPVDTGPATLSAHLGSDGTDWNASLSVTVDESELMFGANLADVTTTPVLRGLVESDLIKIDHLKTIVAAAIELRKVADISQPAGEEADPEADDQTAEPEEPKAMQNVTLRPLGQSILLSGMDLDVDVDLRKIEGARAISSLQSELTLKDKELNAGPLRFELGGGHFDVHGKMDLSQDVHLLEVKGSAGGWQLADLLGLLNFRKGASGTLNANFDFAGQPTSVEGFVGSMNGAATVAMSNGSIETQLLDLAGLGVLPWLFSSEKQKVAPIVCLRAPITISGGQIVTKQTTLETDQVQVVVFGSANVLKKALDINVQPRKIGDPLARSPWPITISGALNDPKIKVKDGPKRLRRTDGADKMPENRQHCVPDILQLQ